MPDVVEPCRCVYPERCFCPPEARQAEPPPEPPPWRGHLYDLKMAQAGEFRATGLDAAHRVARRVNEAVRAALEADPPESAVGDPLHASVRVGGFLEVGAPDDVLDVLEVDLRLCAPHREHLLRRDGRRPLVAAAGEADVTEPKTTVEFAALRLRDGVAIARDELAEHGLVGDPLWAELDDRIGDLIEALPEPPARAYAR